MEFGAKIAQRRESRGWTPEKLAGKLGINVKFIQQWEANEEFPSKIQLLALGCALKLKPETMLFDDTDEMMRHINAAEMRETVVLAALSVVTLACALALIAIGDISPDMLDVAATITQIVLAGTFVAILFARRSDSAILARRYADALEVCSCPRAICPGWCCSAPRQPASRITHIHDSPPNKVGPDSGTQPLSGPTLFGGDELPDTENTRPKFDQD